MGTPPGEDGSADLQQVLAVAREIGQSMEDEKIVITKSTAMVITTAERPSRAASTPSAAALVVFPTPPAPQQTITRRSRIICSTSSVSAIALCRLDISLHFLEQLQALLGTLVKQ